MKIFPLIKPRLHKIHLFYDGQFLNFLIYFPLEEFLAIKVLIDLFPIPDKISHSNSECTFNVKTLLVHDNDIMIDNSIVGSPTNTLIVELEERERERGIIFFFYHFIAIFLSLKKILKYTIKMGTETQFVLETISSILKRKYCQR